MSGFVQSLGGSYYLALRSHTRTSGHEFRGKRTKTRSRHAVADGPSLVPAHCIIRPHMPLTSGTKLGPYEIQSVLGSGGMGEVYRARDTRLDRTVALKILPAAFSTEPDRLHRFQHEAKILSTLNHPNVLAIYDVGEQNGIRFLVSEFLEGQSLREVLAAGTLSRRKLIDFALDVAKGLAAAHEKGIVHRDLKPDNVFITRDDRVKVLDFGLAKQAPDPTSEDSATMTGGVPTTPGTVMGTVGYMSPEQVRGQPLD